MLDDHIEVKIFMMRRIKLKKKKHGSCFFINFLRLTMYLHAHVNG